MFSIFPVNNFTTNISVFILLIFKVIHTLEDISYRKSGGDYFPCRAVLHILLLHSDIPARTSSQHLNVFCFFSSSIAHRLIHNLQGQFMHLHMFQLGALSRNVSQHVEKDTVPTCRLQIDYFDELLATLFSKLCI